MEANVRHLMAQLRTHPLDLGVLDALRRHCEVTRSFSVWAEALEQHARAANAAQRDRGELGRLHFELGNLYRDQLRDPGRALTNYLTALEQDAGHRPALVSARTLYAEAGQSQHVAELLERELSLLPSGPDRLTVLVELGRVRQMQLGDQEGALTVLRAAAREVPSDLPVQHELATALLEAADTEPHAFSAEPRRREAADVLCAMARAVSDDYAFAYVEAALDAVPDHADALALHEALAPRVGRNETLAPRWLVAIRATRDPGLARALRLRMARAYRSVGQLADARICLEPLLGQNDREAEALGRALDRSEGARTASEPEPDSEIDGEEPLESADVLLESAEASAEIDDSLAALTVHAPERVSDAGAPLADLAMIARAEPTSQASEPDLRSLLESGEAGPIDLVEEHALSEPSAPQRGLAAAHEDEILTAPGADALRQIDEESDDEVSPTSRPPAPERASARPSPAPIEPMREDDEPDPFAEQTQPRAAPLTLAELTALTGRDAEELGLTLKEDEPPRDSEVTQVTPPEDAELTELRSLRTELTRRLRFRDRRGAAEVAETLIERGVFDVEAIEALEEQCRLTRDFRRLRDLCMRIAGEPSFSDEIRTARLREAVMLSEGKLGDAEGTAAALRALLAHSPHDAEAFDKLKRLLKRTQRWDELAQLFDQRARRSDDPLARAALLRELGALERDKRKKPERAIEAYARAREIDPGHAEDDVILSALYVESGRFAEAAAMYERRLIGADAAQKSELLATLADLYEAKLNDDVGARRTLAAWRAAEPRRLEPLHALIRVLDRMQAHEALVDALTDLLALCPPHDRARVHVRIAELAFEKLDDAARAADSYGEAITLAPGQRALWQAAAPAYERAGRVRELDELLWGLAQAGRDRVLQSALYEHVAKTRAARSELSGAITAREAQLALSQDAAVLDALVALLREAERPAELSRRLDELARRSERETARALRLERATLLRDKLRDPEAAKAELERLLAEIDGDDTTALRTLIELCIATGDTLRRASAQERLIKLAPSLSARIALAVELVDIYERELDDTEGTLRVLLAWTTLEPDNPQPYLRLAPLLAHARRRRELLATLDRLTALSVTDEEAGEFLLRAARVAIELEDYEGAWTRLVPRVVEASDKAAEQLLEELASTAGRGEALAALYVGLAQRAGEPAIEQQRWTDAARAFEQQVGAYDRALEAMLRALAKELDNGLLLAEVERLAERAHAWPRLAQVYDTLVRRAEDVEGRVRLLMRHARLLELRAEDGGAAFERTWLAFQVDPTRDDTYEEAKRLALSTGRHSELLTVHEKRAQSAASIEARLEALLEGCALAQQAFDDTPRATGYLARAVALAGSQPALLDEVEGKARQLDEEMPPIHGRGLLAELASVYALLSDEKGRAPQLAAIWLTRAARLHELALDDVDAAFRALEHASALVPSDESLLDELYRVAALSERWEALAAHLQRASEVALDGKSSSAALRRLGALCERELFSPSRAADAYEQLVRLRPDDLEASRRLRMCLRAAQRFEELLIAIDRELFMLKPEASGRRELLKQAAEAWEFGLKNRYEALDAWKKVQAHTPDDPDVAAALTRLRARPRADESLLDEEVVVLPEDLRPSLGGPELDSGLFGTPVEPALGPGAFLAERVVSLRESSLEMSIEPEEVTIEDLSLLSGELSTHSGELSVSLESGTLAADALDRALDQEMTIPLDERRARDVAPNGTSVSLEGLSALVQQQVAQSASVRAPGAPTPPPVLAAEHEEHE